jgi:hypothetical protein
LDWNWNVRIADFGHSFWVKECENPSFNCPDADFKSPSLDSRYLAPECYNSGPYLQLSDVFSFGLIVYELLTGEPAFSEDLSQNQIAFKIAVKNERPVIPAFILPSTQDLITTCWATEPGDRPTFDDIVDQLKEMNFKVIKNVNSSTIWKFVNEIEKCEKANTVTDNAIPK